MSWGAWWVAVAVLWLLVMPLLLGVGIMVLSKLPSQRPVLRVEIESGCLTRAGLEEPIDRGVLVELVELSAWTEWLGAWRQFLQWSAVVRDDEQYVVVPLLTVVDPTVEEVRLVGQLCSQFDCPLTQIDEGPVPAVAGAPEEP